MNNPKYEGSRKLENPRTFRYWKGIDKKYHESQCNVRVIYRQINWEESVRARKVFCPSVSFVPTLLENGTCFTTFLRVVYSVLAFESLQNLHLVTSNLWDTNFQAIFGPKSWSPKTGSASCERTLLSLNGSLLHVNNSSLTLIKKHFPLQNYILTFR